jgi:tetratricopeptide (TPR) repeat protein
MRWGWVLVTVCLGCAGSAIRDERKLTAQTADIDRWLAAWKGPQPKIAIKLDGPEKGPAAHQRCLEGLRHHLAYLSDNADVVATLWLQDLHKKLVITYKGEEKVNEPPNATYMVTLCQIAFSRALMVFGDVTPVQPVATAAAVPPTASAPSNSRADESPGDMDAPGGKEHFRAGMAYFKAGLFSKALEQYQLAYEKLPLPDTLYNIAQCYQRMKRQAEAIRYFERYVAIQPTGEGADDARAQIKALRGR